MNASFIPSCILCKDALDYDQAAMDLTDSSIGPGRLHRDCYNQLCYAQAMLKGAGLRECKRVQR